MKRMLLSLSIYLLLTVQNVFGNNFYSGVNAGFNWLISDHDGKWTTHYNTGSTVVGVLGYKWNCGLRIESEFGFRYNKIPKVKLIEDVNPIREEKLKKKVERTHGNIYSWSTMANVLYMFPVSYTSFCISPYIGGGVGYSKSHTSIKHKPKSVSENSGEGLTYQAIAGFEYPLYECISGDVKFRYQKSKKLKANYSLELGLVYPF